MKKILFGAMMLVSMTVSAQETYINAELATEDLSGSARYVGMGGAMEALGADISTIGTNPAGIGLFRRSMISITGGLISQQDAPDNANADGTFPSLDQIGAVWSTNFGAGRYFNVGFSYRKSRSYNQNICKYGLLGNGSQNCNSYMNLMDAAMAGADIDTDLGISQLDALYYNTLVGDQDGWMYYNTAKDYNLERAITGYNANYDINLSGNVSSRCYLGMTIGISDLRYKAWSAYTENLLNGNDLPIGSVTVNDYREITGTGANLKFGTIFFPIEGSPLRFGASIETPTWYDMTTFNKTTLANNAQTGGTPYNPKYVSSDDYDYKMYTPWKFGLSVGHTISNYIALGLSYQYADYGNIKSRIIDGYDYYGESYSSNDVNMNQHTDATLKGVSTFKFGTEVKPTPEWAVRLGYNYVSPMYRSTGYRDGTVYSVGTYYSSQSDYTNWHATNRVTCGFGYSKNGFSIDVAYQYNTTKGDFSPFMNSYADYTYDDNGVIDEWSVDNQVSPIEVKNQRHQILATLSYKF